MSSFEDIEEKIRLREQKIKARELEVRLKEIEHELDEIPVQQTTQHQEPVAPKRKKSLSKKTTDIAKFCAITLSVIIAVHIAAWLSTALIVVGVLWLAYKLFIEAD